MENAEPNAVARSDEETVRRLVADNLNLVYKEAWRTAGAWAGGETEAERRALAGELSQEGVRGLRRAAEKFDPARGCAFSTYAVPWIRKRTGEAAAAWSAARAASTLDAPLGEDGSASLADMIPDENAESPAEAADRSMARDYARALLAGLPGRDRAMVEMHFGFRGGRSATFAEIGAAFGVSAQRAARVVERALRRMRAAAVA